MSEQCEIPESACFGARAIDRNCIYIYISLELDKINELNSKRLL